MPNATFTIWNRYARLLHNAFELFGMYVQNAIRYKYIRYWLADKMCPKWMVDHAQNIGTRTHIHIKQECRIRRSFHEFFHTKNDDSENQIYAKDSFQHQFDGIIFQTDAI